MGRGRAIRYAIDAIDECESRPSANRVGFTLISGFRICERRTGYQHVIATCNVDPLIGHFSPNPQT
jgi:hypothetical protein